MTAAEIRTKIRRGIREPKAIRVSNTIIDDIVLDGIIIFGMEIKAVASSFFNKRVSLTSNTHVFAWPSDCASILNVRDLRTNAKTITGASNATPIVIDCVAHGFSDDGIIVVHGVLGNTAANGTWKVANKTDDTLELTGSVGAVDYTSGGKMFKESTSFTWIRKKEPSEIGLDDKTVWYPRERNIVVGKYDFTNDILIEYVSVPDAVEDIPAEYHIGLVAYGITTLLRLPSHKDKGYADKKMSLDHSLGVLKLVLEQIRTGVAASINPEPIYFTPGED